MHFNKPFIVAAAVAVLSVSPVIAATNANFGQVISSIQASKTDASQIQAVTTVSSVNVVKVNDLAKGENMNALDQAVTKNEGDIATLRTAMTSNTAVNAALATASVDVATVVAANISTDGVLTVFVR